MCEDPGATCVSEGSTCSENGYTHFGLQTTAPEIAGSGGCGVSPASVWLGAVGCERASLTGPHCWNITGAVLDSFLVCMHD